MRSNRRNGLTLLEVIFAMVVILVGMVSVAILIPLAGRQAADSYQTTQGLALGESAIAMIEEARGFQPSEDNPWCIVDGNNTMTISKISEYYNESAINRAKANNLLNTYNFARSAVVASKVQNSVLGEGFCLDPMFWGFQGPLSPQPPKFARDIFPFWLQTVDVSTFTDLPADVFVPRLRRVSFAGNDGAWMRQPTATRFATIFGGDVVQAESAKNKAAPPMRGVYEFKDSATGNPITVSSAVWSPNVSCMITLTPSENTPVIPTDAVQGNTAIGYSVMPVAKPKSFDAAIVVFSKRDVRETTGSAFTSDWSNNLPVSEKALNVTYFSPESLTSGSFEIALEGHPNLDPRIRVGSWLMMSRMSYRDLIPNNDGKFQRQVHRWYRIVAVDRDGPWPVRVRVVGKPWGPTDGEVLDYKNNGSRYDLYSYVQAVVLKDVIQVFEREIQIDQ